MYKLLGGNNIYFGRKLLRQYTQNILHSVVTLVVKQHQMIYTNKYENHPKVDDIWKSGLLHAIHTSSEAYSVDTREQC